MLLKCHFRAQQDKTVPIFRVKSDWKPPEHSFPPFQKYFRHVLKDITDLYQQPITNTANLSQDEIKALSELKQMKDVVIKSAGKGGKIVIWPVEQYLAEAHQQLSDEKYYKQQNTDHTVETAYEIYTFLTYLNNNYYINDDLFNFLKPHSPP